MDNFMLKILITLRILLRTNWFVLIQAGKEYCQNQWLSGVENGTCSISSGRRMNMSYQSPSDPDHTGASKHLSVPVDSLSKLNQTRCLPDLLTISEHMVDPGRKSFFESQRSGRDLILRKPINRDWRSEQTVHSINPSLASLVIGLARIPFLVQKQEVGSELSQPRMHSREVTLRFGISGRPNPPLISFFQEQGRSVSAMFVLSDRAEISFSGRAKSGTNHPAHVLPGKIGDKPSQDFSSQPSRTADNEGAAEQRVALKSNLAVYIGLWLKELLLFIKMLCQAILGTDAFSTQTLHLSHASISLQETEKVTPEILAWSSVQARDDYHCPRKSIASSKLRLYASYHQAANKPFY